MGALHQLRPVLGFRHSAEGLTHDCDQHVEEHDLGEQSGEDEVDPDEYVGGVRCQGIQGELTKADQVLIEEGVSELVFEGFIPKGFQLCDLAVLVGLRLDLVEHVESIREDTNTHEEHQHKPADI